MSHPYSGEYEDNNGQEPETTVEEAVKQEMKEVARKADATGELETIVGRMELVDFKLRDL